MLGRDHQAPRTDKPLSLIPNTGPQLQIANQGESQLSHADGIPDSPLDVEISVARSYLRLETGHGTISSTGPGQPDLDARHASSIFILDHDGDVWPPLRLA